MRKIIVVGVVLMIAVFCAGVYAEEKTGASDITITAGKKKSIDFPHKTHQTVLKDCSICHAIFPKEPGVILKRIGDGKLKKKQVMKKCQGCHKKMKKAGQKTGPTSCGSCHSG